MKNKLTTLVPVLLTAIFALFAAKTSMAAPKPVAIVGSSYGVSEKTSLTRHILTAASDTQLRYVDMGEFIDVDRLPEFSLVILCYQLGRELTEDENRAFADYVASGGHVLMIATVINSLPAEPEQRAWTGIQRVNWRRNSVPCEILQGSHAWLEGIDLETERPFWMNARFLATPLEDGMQPIIGDDSGASLVGIHKHGRGWVAFLGDEHFRMYNRRRHPPERRGEQRLWANLIANIITASGALLEDDFTESWFDSLTTEASVWLWRREWQAGERYGPRFDPPGPEPDEFATSFELDLAVDEYELTALNITALRDVGLVEASLVSDDFPLDKAQIFVQERPDPIPWEKNPELAVEVPFWLMPPERVAPKGSPRFGIEPRETKVLWLKFSSFDLAPGSYKLELRLAFEKHPALSLPVTLNAHSVRLPRNRHIKLAPSGANFGGPTDVAQAMRFLRNTDELGYEWTQLTIIRPNAANLRGETNSLEIAALRQCAEQLTTGQELPLDFKALDAWLENSLEHNLIQVKSGAPLGYLPGLIRRAGITDERQIALLEEWFCRSLSRHLWEKGFRVMTTSFGDELSYDALIERYIPWARKMNSYGWACSSTFTGIKHCDPELNSQLYPYVGLWTLNRGLGIPFTEALKNGSVQMRPGAILGTYGAGEGRGTEIRKTISQSRFLGWESWKLGIRNCAPNPYFKGWLYYLDYGSRGTGAGERLVGYLDKDDLSAPLVTSPFVEGIREGLEDGNLAALLSWYLEHLPESQVRADVQSRLSRILGTAPDSILPYHVATRRSQLSVMQIAGDNDNYQRAKREVLECIEQLRPEIERHIKPSLYWHDIALVSNGVVRAAIYIGDVPTDDLAAAILKVGACELPILTGADRLDPRYPVAIVLGNGQQNPLAASLLAQRGADDATAAYPGVGSYLVREWPNPASEGGILLHVAGPDAAGSAKGVRLFGRFLRGQGTWLLPVAP